MAITRTNSNDFFNTQKLRTVQNTLAFEYNCGGYALNTYSWYCPHQWKTDRNYNPSTKLASKTVTRHAVNFMLKEFNNLRVIKDIEELQPNEYAIAFRIGGVDGNHDFHFMKRNANGRWYSKSGGMPIRSIKTAKVFADCWELGEYGVKIKYYGELVLFAKKF